LIALIYIVCFAGVTGAYSPITAVKFSHVRPSVFAATSSDGFLYIFDLSRSLAGPVAKLEALAYSGDNITKEELRNYKGDFFKWDKFRQLIESTSFTPYLRKRPDMFSCVIFRSWFRVSRTNRVDECLFQ
jgi:hypothetical protein